LSKRYAEIGIKGLKLISDSKEQNSVSLPV